MEVLDCFPIYRGNRIVVEDLTKTFYTKQDHLKDLGQAAWAWLHSQAETDSLTMERLAGEFLPMIPALRLWL